MLLLTTNYAIFFVLNPVFHQNLNVKQTLLYINWGSSQYSYYICHLEKQFISLSVNPCISL